MADMFELAVDRAGGTHYRASARHWDEATMLNHKEMGFEGGWGVAADQLLAVARRVAGKAL